MPDAFIRISLFTRINIMPGVLVISFAPLLWTWPAVRAGEMDEQSWIVLVLELALVLAFTRRPAYRFQRLVHAFYRNRMEQ